MTTKEMLVDLRKIEQAERKYRHKKDCFEAGEAACWAMEQVFLGRTRGKDPIKLFHSARRRLRSTRLLIPSGHNRRTQEE